LLEASSKTLSNKVFTNNNYFYSVKESEYIPINYANSSSKSGVYSANSFIPIFKLKLPNLAKKSYTFFISLNFKSIFPF